MSSFDKGFEAFDVSKGVRAAAVIDGQNHPKPVQPTAFAICYLVYKYSTDTPSQMFVTRNFYIGMIDRLAQEILRLALIQDATSLCQKWNVRLHKINL